MNNIGRLVGGDPMGWLWLAFHWAGNFDKHFVVIQGIVAKM